jgi:hypothetical protein
MISPSAATAAAQQILSPVTSGGSASPLQSLAADLDSWISSVLGGSTSATGSAGQTQAAAASARHHHHHHATAATAITNGATSAASSSPADVNRALQAYGASG